MNFQDDIDAEVLIQREINSQLKNIKIASNPRPKSMVTNYY